MRVATVVLVAVVVACGGTTKPEIASREPGASPPATAIPALPPGPTCEARMDLPNGFHDRYLFRDEVAERVGYKTAAGAIVIPALFLDGYPFTPGGVAAVIDGTTPFVFIDTHGKVIGKAFAYDNGPDYYQEGFARIVGPDGKIGFIGETSGRIEIPATFDKAAPFCEGKAHVLVGGQEFDIDPRGQRIP